MECNLTLASKSVSRKHSKISLKREVLVVTDLKSTNGTFVNNKKITKDTLLSNGDSIIFGEFKFIIYHKSPIKEECFTKTSLLENPLKSDDFIKYFKITKKETEILSMLLEGNSTANIAKMFSITAGTAKNHILNIYKKTKTHSKFELLALFNDFGKK